MQTSQGFQVVEAKNVPDIIRQVQEWLNGPILTLQGHPAWDVIEHPPTPNYRTEAALRVTDETGKPLVQFGLTAHRSGYDAQGPGIDGGMVWVDYLDLRVSVVPLATNLAESYNANELLLRQLKTYRFSFPEIEGSATAPAAHTLIADNGSRTSALTWHWQLPQHYCTRRPRFFLFWQSN